MSFFENIKAIEENYFDQPDFLLSLSRDIAYNLRDLGDEELRLIRNFLVGKYDESGEYTYRMGILQALVEVIDGRRDRLLYDSNPPPHFEP